MFAWWLLTYWGMAAKITQQTSDEHYCGVSIFSKLWSRVNIWSKRNKENLNSITKQTSVYESPKTAIFIIIIIITANMEIRNGKVKKSNNFSWSNRLVISGGDCWEESHEMRKNHVRSDITLSSPTADNLRNRKAILPNNRCLSLP